VGLEWGPFSLVRIIEALFKGNSGSGLENRNKLPWESIAFTTRHPLSAKVGTDFGQKRRSLGRHTSLANYRPRSFMKFYDVTDTRGILSFYGVVSVERNITTQWIYEILIYILVLGRQ
jgi:hypothetical protein